MLPDMLADLLLVRQQMAFESAHVSVSISDVDGGAFEQQRSAPRTLTATSLS